MIDVVFESNPLDDIGVYRDVLVVVNDGTIMVNRIQWQLGGR